LKREREREKIIKNLHGIRYILLESYRNLHQNPFCLLPSLDDLIFYSPITQAHFRILFPLSNSIMN